MLFLDPFIGMAGGADFDGTYDYMTRSGLLTGVSNGKKGIFSGWVRLDGSDSVVLGILSTANSGNNIFNVLRTGGGTFQISGIGETTGFTVLSLNTVLTYAASATWLHVLSSWDLGNNLKHLYINDVSDLSATIFSNEAINYTSSGILWDIGTVSASSGRMNGCLAELYFNPAEYIDLSDVNNRRKFITAGGKPAFLGLTGQLPTGTAPAIYQSIGGGNVNDFALNRGMGGNFTIVDPLLASSTNPSD